VYAWGDDTHGQLGDGSETQSDVPVQVDLPAGVTVTAIAAGDGDIIGLTGGYSLALTSTGAVYAWGDNTSGNLGDNSTTDSDVPVLVQVPAGVTATGISAGGNRCQLLTSAGRLYNWGTAENGSDIVLTPDLDVLPPGETPVLVNDGPDAEQYLVLMVPSSTGAVYAWGDDDSGQLGVGSYVDSSKWEASEMPAGTQSVYVTAGQSTSSAVTTTGAVYAWGYDFDGQLGNDSTVNTTVPVETDMPAGVITTTVAIGWDQELALTSTGSVYAWGLNRYGELGIGSTEKFGDVPVQVTFPAGVVIASIATGAYQSLALSTAGQIYAWGQNTYGQLGTGTTTNSDVPLPVALPGGIPVALAGGDKDSFAVTQSGAVFAWGDNTYGQLGNGTFTASDTPALVSLPSGVKVQQVESGGQSPTAEPQSGLYALALTDTGQVYAWGSNAIGQLGDDSTTTSNVPVLSLVPSGVTIVQIGAGSNYAHALTNTGSIYYWGTQARGKDQQLDPVISPLPSGLNAVALSTGPDAEQSIALMQSTG
jgi:alpha-tubulin suppressor-like RCC1 family protein